MLSMTRVVAPASFHMYVCTSKSLGHKKGEKTLPAEGDEPMAFFDGACYQCLVTLVTRQ
jgi:hypothetical protein